MSPAGVLLIDKQPGETSFRSLGSIRRTMCKKVGHTGTLDKFATGLLVVLVGPFTKLNPFFTNLDKEYKAVFRFGMETETLDPEGAITETGPVPDLEAIQHACEAFTGTQMQRPPLYSAVHVDGKRAYKRARDGEQVELVAREITVSSIIIDAWQPPYLHLRISCSKGTYIRSLARDMGKCMGTCAFVSELSRTRVGPFLLEQAKPAEQASIADVRGDREIFESLGGFSYGVVRQDVIDKVKNGMLAGIDWLSDYEYVPDSSFCVFYDERGSLAALGRIEAADPNSITCSSYVFVVPAGM
jgi:tRNA pseudouridine55 synthase